MHIKLASWDCIAHHYRLGSALCIESRESRSQRNYSEVRIATRLLKMTSSLCSSHVSSNCSNEREYHGFEKVV